MSSNGTGKSAPTAEAEMGDTVDGFLVKRENSTRILVPEEAVAFFNPVQEFNRDLSVACSRVWAERAERARVERVTKERERGEKGEGKGRGRGKKARGELVYFPWMCDFELKEYSKLRMGNKTLQKMELRNRLKLLWPRRK